MSRALPMAQCLALLHAFDKDNPAPQQAIATAGAYLEGKIIPASFDDLNNGQFAALIDFVLANGHLAFEASDICDWVQNGNLTLPQYELALYGKRGLAQRDMWNLGNSE